MSASILTQKITGPAAWRGCDLYEDDAWIHHLSAASIEALDTALQQVKSSGLTLEQLDRGDFPLPELSADLARFSRELEHGRGFLLLRGFPVERYSEADLRIVYFGLGLNLGIPVRQNPRGDLLGEVINAGDPTRKETRVYETNSHLPFHTDPSDVVGLLCLRRARSGGLSSLVSVAAVYNELLERYPQYLGVFYRPVYYAHLGEDFPSRSPLFSYHAGKLGFRYLRQYIELGHEIMQTPLTRVEIEALDILDSIIAEPRMRLDMMLEPGDLQFANNYMVLHSRTQFEDHEDAKMRRKMLRLWLKMPNARKLAPDFPGRNGFPAPGEAPV